MIKNWEELTEKERNKLILEVRAWADWRDTCDWKYDNWVKKIKKGEPMELE